MAYFFKTVKEDGRNRLRPLPGQCLADGTPINPSLNTQADSVMRGSYPIGTVYGSESLEQRNGFYSAGPIYPMGLPLGQYVVASHMPSQSLKDAYDAYKAAQAALAAGPSLFGDESETAQASPEAPAPAEAAPAAEKRKAAPKAAPKTLLDELRSDPACACPTVEGDGFSVKERDWMLILRNIRAKINTLMVGASGCGKTELVMLACRKLGIDCHVYDMGSMYDPVSGLLGVHRLRQGGVSEFDYAQFTRDIQKPGVVLLDELSRAPVTTNNILFPCLDSRRTLPVEMAGGADMRSIPVHPECVFFATANVGAEYTGTMTLDRALVGRFFPLELGFMPATEETKVLSKRCAIAQTAAANIVAVAATVRSLFSKGEVSATVSTRETLMAGNLVRDGWSALDAMEMTFLPLFEGGDKDGERAVVRKIFMTK